MLYNVFNEASQDVQPQVKSDMNPEDAPRLAGNNNEPVVIEPHDAGQQNDTLHTVTYACRKQGWK